jgi:acetone carboxylase gamma subunit
MKMNMLKVLGLASVLFMMTACGESTDVVESGTYEGKVKKVEAEKSEIYVETTDDKTLELYFTDETKLTKGGEAAEFSALEKGQKVEVEVEKVGKRLDPISVNIMD